jgi:adenosylcobinamide-GDP ribazoletransferase
VTLVAFPRQVSLFLVATQFLTRLPVWEQPDFQPAWLSRSARYFPLVGALVGIINVAVWWLCSRWFPPAVSVGFMIVASLLVTGAFHEDGFADTCDGFGGGTTAERVLAIMKDSRIGAYGAIGIVMLLGLKWATLVAIPVTVLPFLVIAAHTMSRWCSIGLIWGLGYVRSGGGKSKPLADGLSGFDWILSGLIGAIALVPVALASDFGHHGLNVRICVGAALAALVASGIAAAYFWRRIGGYTGDCLGAVQQISELVFLCAALGILTPARPVS